MTQISLWRSGVNRERGRGHNLNNSSNNEARGKAAKGEGGGQRACCLSGAPEHWAPLPGDGSDLCSTPLTFTVTDVVQMKSLLISISFAGQLSWHSLTPLPCLSN